MAIPKEHPALWSKLADLPLDRLAGEPSASYGFAQRLRDDKGWDYGTTVRVIAEYRRFLYLSSLGPVCPSEAVDAVWHMHLTYTRAYWTGLCEGTLGQPLNHTPNAGAAATEAFKSLYEDTLNRYRRSFGEDPPKDIWPPVARHFAARDRRATCVSLARMLALFAAVSAMWWLNAAKFTGVFGVVVLTLLLVISTASAAETKRKRDSGIDSASGCSGGPGDGGSSGCGGCGGGGCG